MSAAPLRYAFHTIVALSALLLTRDKLFELHFVEGPSMAPALSPDYETTRARDILLIRKWNATRNLKRGDVVSYWAPHNPEKFALKRVVGLPGDVVFTRRVRGRRGETRDFGDEDGKEKEGRVDGEGDIWQDDGMWRDGMLKPGREAGKDLYPLRKVVVPYGCLWVEGDNWRSTVDSNDFGPVPISLLAGKASCVVWPLRRWGDVPPNTVSSSGFGTKVIPGRAVLPDTYRDDW